MTELALGIDLGTTNSCVAVMRGGRCEIVPFAGGARTVPSMIWIDEQGATLVGHAAKQKFLTHPKNTIYGAKRLMGRRFSSQEMDEIRKRFFYEIGQNDQGEPMVRAGNRYLDLVEVGAIILSHCKEAARDYLQTSVDSAVISVPAYFTQRQREAVKQAGEKAGLDVLRIVNEPTAAALAYGVMHRENQRILVYDLGGGTFDVTVLEIKNQTYEVLATGGDSFLGGIDFDNQLVNYFAALIKKRQGADVSVDYSALQRLRSAAESAKIDLSATQAAQITVPFLLPDDGSGKPLDFSHRVTRDLFEEMVRPLVLKTLKLVNKVLLDAKLQREDIDELVFVGGMTRMPLVEQIITKHFGKKPRKDVHPDEVVAQGAAILANGIANRLGSIKLVDVLPVSIGIAVDDSPYQTLVPNNTPVPHEVSRKFKTGRDNQTGSTIRVFQGESDQAAENEYLGALNVAGFPPRPAGQVEFSVNLSLDQDSILLVTATSTTGQAFFSQFLTERMVEKETFFTEAGVGENEPTSAAAAKAAIKDTIRAALQRQANEPARTTPKHSPPPEVPAKVEDKIDQGGRQIIQELDDIDTADLIPEAPPAVKATPPAAVVSTPAAKDPAHVPASSLFGSRKPTTKASKPVAPSRPVPQKPATDALFEDIDALVAEAESTYTPPDDDDDFVDRPSPAFSAAKSAPSGAANRSKSSESATLTAETVAVHIQADLEPVETKMAFADDQPKNLKAAAEDAINFGALEEFLQEATQAKDIDEFLDDAVRSAKPKEAKAKASANESKTKKLGLFGSD